MTEHRNSLYCGPMEALRQYLDRQKMSQAQFAEQVGVKQPSVWEWLNGDSNPSIDSLKKISEITGISIDKLLADKAE